MQLRTALCYNYSYKMIFITQFLKSNVNYTTSGSGPPPPQRKILGAHLGVLVRICNVLGSNIHTETCHPIRSITVSPVTPANALTGPLKDHFFLSNPLECIIYAYYAIFFRHVRFTWISDNFIKFLKDV
jgi:hypothetical protein